MERQPGCFSTVGASPACLIEGHILLLRSLLKNREGIGMTDTWPNMSKKKGSRKQCPEATLGNLELNGERAKRTQVILKVYEQEEN